ncbi:MAG: hypothetical protein PGN34_25280 [Methylobacterium frigidaeris]
MIEIFPFGDNDHNQQVLAGFDALKRLGCLDFRYRYDGIRTFRMETKGKGEFSAVYQIVVMRLDDGKQIVFDLNDGDIVFENLYDSCFLYFKRSYCGKAHAQRSRMLPLGLNYEARPPFLSLSAIARSIILSKNPVSRARGVLRVLGLPRPYTYDPGKDRHLKVLVASVPRVLFLARTWDPAEFDPKYHSHLTRINSQRAACVRGLRRTFGDQFTGGLLPSPHARSMFPDCLVPDDWKTDRRSFLKLVDSHQICVSSSGLHDSTGWKFAEFVAKGRAIVTETMRFQVPGPMADGINYFSFTDTDECIDRCRALMDDPHLRYAMMSANRAYYDGYVAPEAMVRNAIGRICSGIEAMDRPRTASAEHRRSA